MGRQITNLSLQEGTREALEEFAKMLGVNRSVAADMILRAALDVETDSLLQAMQKVLRVQGKATEGEVMGAYFDALKRD